MKVTILQENLLKGISSVSRVAAVGAQMPILSHVLLVAEKSGLRVLGSNLEVSVVIKFGARVEGEGSMAVPAKIFGEFVGSLQPGKVELSASEERLTVKSGGVVAKFQGMNPSEFPKIPTKIGKKIWEYEGGLDKEIEQVVFAAASEESRPVLTGVEWLRQGEKLQMAATDGYRLSVKQMKVKFESEKGKEGGEWKKIVPARTLIEVGHFIRAFGGDGVVRVGVTSEGNQLVFEFGETVVASRLLEGEFPEFGQIVPKETKTTVKINIEELTSAVRMAAIFARESAHIVKWEVGKERLIIKAQSPQVGENESTVEAEVSGQGGEISFNSRYLLEFLNSVAESDKKKRVVFGMGGALLPGLFKIEGKEDFLHVIMPIRVQE